MPSDTECSFSSDSLDDRAIRDENSQRDSSTVISEFSSTKTLMNIDDDIRLPFDEDEVPSKEFLSRRYSDSLGTEENVISIQYSWQINVSHKEQGSNVSLLLREKDKDGSSILDIQKVVTSEVKHQENKQNISKISNASSQLFPIEMKCTKYIAPKKITNELLTTHESFSCESTSKKQKQVMSIESKKKKIVHDFNEFPSSKYKKKIQEHSDAGVITSPDDSKSAFYLSSIEEKSETPSRNQKNLNIKINKIISEEFVINPTYDYKRKYHTYPKSKIPILKCARKQRLENYVMDPRMFPLEPREIDLESFQQLHTADSQEELQEFLLLESQCSGNLGLASDAFTSEFYSEYCTDDERGTMSDY
ncbi:uncharacterized protein [Anoplolepis gracilipes]|uniref:uncharacterized protein n=1 Tax=Anoplolepis gracilipes TaxID=354296 RepID=UPI003BA1271C